MSETRPRRARRRERLYLQRLRLFKLSMLWASPVGGGIAPSKVYAAWRALRSDDVKAVSAALEVLDTTLPPKLSSLVMPLLNDAVALDKKLKLAAQVRDLRLPPGGVPSKPWIVQYFSESGDPLGQDLGGLCGWLSVATGRGGAAQLIQARARTRQAQRSASPVAAVEASASQYGSAGSQFGGSTAADAFESSTKVPESQIGGSVGPRRSMQRGSTHATASGSEMLLSVDPTKAIKRSISDEGPLDEERAARRAKSSEEAVESIGPPPTTGLAQRVLLLRSSRVFRGVLTLHVAAIGQRAVEVEVAEGDEFTRAGASYFLVEGAASRVRSDGGVKVYHSGETIQELGCIDEKLPVLPCRAEEASKLLVLRPGDVWSLMLRLPPKFALSLLRALVTFAPSRSHGGGKQPMRQSSVMGEAPRSVSPPAAGAPMLPPARDSAEVRITMPPESPAARARLTELAGGDGGDGGEALERSSMDAVEEGPEEDFGEDVSGESELVAPEVEGEGDRPRERARIAFTREERAWLMRQVKLLRYVHRRFIPYLADIAVEARVSAGEIVCEQGQPTTPGLIIVACGKLELWRKPLRGGDPVLLRELTAGDSLGNTGLIADVHWEYTAVGKEDAWTLTIHRDDLANLLRGRAELSLSVLKGFYKTFVRRLRQVLEQEGGITDSWLLAADVDKSPIKSDRHRRDPFLGMAPPKELSASESAVALPLIPQ